MTEHTDHLRNDAFVSHLAQAIDSRTPLAPGQAVVVGVSGGLDSVALLTGLATLAGDPDRAYRLTVAHLNHALRADADADQAFVESLAEAMGMPSCGDRVDIAARAQADGESIETAARAARYEFLRDVAARANAPTVAVAHHFDDNVETVLHRIVRGTHLRGLAGMIAKRPLLGTDIQLIRPMLDIRRADIEAFAGRHALTWREDHTNADPRYTRNALRHEVLPLLADRFNPRIGDAIDRLARAASQAETFLAAAGRALLDQSRRDDGALNIAPLRDAEPLLRQYALRDALEQFGAPMRHLGHERLTDLDALLTTSEPGAINLPGGILARCTDTTLSFHWPAPDAPADTTAWPIYLTIPGTTPLGSAGHIEARIEPSDPDALARFRANPRAGVQWLDADALAGPLHVGPRQPADRFVPLGAPGTQTVGDFLTNIKLPASSRDTVLCLRDDNGIACVWPIRIDERVKITPATTRVLTLRAQTSP